MLSCARLAIQNCGPLQTNAYLLWHGAQAVIIDPAIGADDLLQQMCALSEKGVQLQAIWNTHGHFDHVYDNARWQSRFDVPIFCHGADAFFLEHLREQALWFGLPAPDIALPQETLEEGQRLRVGEVEVSVLALPGHSPGSVGFAFEDKLIGGDVVFEGSYGRVDLPGADPSQLAASLRRIWQMAPQIQILPGHGAATTLAREQTSNTAAAQLMAQFS